MSVSVRWLLPRCYHPVQRGPCSIDLEADLCTKRRTEGGVRTLMPLRAADFKSAASAGSATSACPDDTSSLSTLPDQQEFFSGSRYSTRCWAKVNAASSSQLASGRMWSHASTEKGVDMSSNPGDDDLRAVAARLRRRRRRGDPPRTAAAHPGSPRRARPCRAPRCSRARGCAPSHRVARDVRAVEPGPQRPGAGGVVVVARGRRAQRVLDRARRADMGVAAVRLFDALGHAARRRRQDLVARVALVARRRADRHERRGDRDRDHRREPDAATAGRSSRSWPRDAVPGDGAGSACRASRGIAGVPPCRRRSDRRPRRCATYRPRLVRAPPVGGGASADRRRSRPRVLPGRHAGSRRV